MNFLRIKNNKVLKFQISTYTLLRADIIRPIKYQGKASRKPHLSIKKLLSNLMALKWSWLHLNCNISITVEEITELYDPHNTFYTASFKS